MRQFIIEQSAADLTSQAGLGLIGRALNHQTDLATAATGVSALRPNAVQHRDILASYIALQCLGKSDFEAITAFRDDEFFYEALDLRDVPSEATLRQRLDEHAEAFRGVVDQASEDFLRRVRAPITALANGLMPLDCDVSPFDNARTHKEGVSRTYKGCDGYAPMLAYLGQEGWCLEVELREGRQHCQKDTPALLARVLERAWRLMPSHQGVLLRLDSGNDALENIAVVLTHNDAHPQAAKAHYLIKWNPRKERAEDWLAYAESDEARAQWNTPRAGKRVALFSVIEDRLDDAYEYPLRRVMRLTERTIDKYGQALLVPELTLEGWWTSLWRDEATIIRLYADHGTSEQFHSEFKTDLDLERFPSGKFATNALVLTCAQLAYNLLRWLGQQGLLGADAPPRHKAKRRRLRTVMQELVYLAARLVRTGRRLKLVFGTHCPAVAIYRRLYLRLAVT